MKSLTLVMTMAVLMAAASGSVRADPTVLTGPFRDEGEAVIIGRFDSGISPWGRCCAWQGSFTSGPGVCGTLGLMARDAQCPGCCPGYTVELRVPVDGGTTYVLSGFFNTERLRQGSLYLDFGDQWWEPRGQGPAWCSVGMHAPIGVAGWQFVYEQVRVPDGVSSVTIRVVRDGERAEGEVCYVDNVALTPLSQFRPPAAGLLITEQPTDQNVGVDVPVTFIVEVASDPMCTTPVTFQWQRRNPLVADPAAANAWINLVDGSGFFGTTAANLSISRPIPALATGYRCKIGGGCGCEPGQGGFVYTITVNFSVACPADFNADGGIDFGDVEAFFERWENGC